MYSNTFLERRRQVPPKLEKVSPWLRERIVDLSMAEELFDEAIAELGTFTNLQNLQYWAPKQRVQLKSPVRVLAAFKTLASGCQNLRSFKLYFKNSQSSVLWHVFKSLLSSLPEFTSLKKLKFWGRDFDEEIVEFTSDERDRLLQGLEKSSLKKLTILYEPCSVASPWQGFGRHLPRTLLRLRFDGEGIPKEISKTSF